MNKEIIRKKFEKSINTYDENAFAQKVIAQKLISLVKKYMKNPENLMELGCGTGILTKMILENFNLKSISINDLSLKNMTDILEKISELRPENINFIETDVEKIKKSKILSGKKFDLILSSSMFQWVKDTENCFYEISKFLKENSYFAFSSFSIENLKEIKEITGISLEYKTKEKLKKELEKYFYIEYLEEDLIKLKFNSVYEILKHLKYTGVNSLNKENWTKSKLNNFIKKYEEKFKENDKFILTYNPIYFILRLK